MAAVRHDSPPQPSGFTFDTCKLFKIILLGNWRASTARSANCPCAGVAEGRKMLRITRSDNAGIATLNLEGKLAGAWVAELERCWRELTAGSPKPSVRVRICSVTFVDEAGKGLLQEMYEQGVELVAEGCLNKAIVARIREAAGSQKLRPAKASKKFPGIVFWVFAVGVLIGGGTMRAQDRGGPQGPQAAAEKPAVGLTLDRAVALALKQNPQVQIAVLSAAQSEQDRSIARAALLPQASLDAQDAARRGNLEANLGRR